MSNLQQDNLSKTAAIIILIVILIIIILGGIYIFMSG
jgi:hypothetical protein